MWNPPTGGLGSSSSHLPHPKADDAPIASRVTKMRSKILSFRMIRFLLHERLIGPLRTEYQKGAAMNLVTDRAK